MSINNIIPFLSRWIPSEIVHDGKSYQFSIFINHPHYDIRFCYDAHSDDAQPSFLFLMENISSDKELLEDLQWLYDQLKTKGYLTGDYATKEGYTREKYNRYMKGLE